jgi:hypothetical protein
MLGGPEQAGKPLFHDPPPTPPLPLKVERLGGSEML